MNLKIGTRLFIGFGISALVFIVMSILSISNINKLSDLTEKLYNHPFTITNSVLRLKSNVLFIRLKTNDIITINSMSDLERLENEINVYDQAINKEFEIINERFLGDKILIDESLREYNQYKSARTEIFNTMRQGDSSSRAEALDMLAKNGSKQYDDVVNVIQKLEDFAINKAKTFYGNAKDVRASSLVIMGVVIVGFLSLIVATTFLTIRSITKPLKETINLSAKIAEGHLDIHFASNSKDELGQLKRSLQSIVDKFKEVIQSVTNTSNNFSISSKQITHTSQDMSQGANEQASSVEEVSASMEEMNSSIQQNTENAQRTDKMATKASEDILRGSQAVEQTVLTMKTIAEKVSIISEIAFRTNILALNAAVEAARAGENGKGFAVVAAEVRKLAERSQVAAKEINEITDESVGIAERTGKLFIEIVPSIQNTAKLVQEITAASIEQSNGTRQVASSFQQLNQIAQQNAAASEELATSAEEMTQQATQIQEIISFFKLGEKNIYA